jgi:hypothetical protein
MTDPTEIREQLDRAAGLVAELPMRQWVGWVLYLLETLDGHANERGEQYDYIEALIRISGAIARRLELGQW